MFALVAHAGHGHGPEPTLVALLAVVAVLGLAAMVAAVRTRRTGRPADRTPPS